MTATPALAHMEERKITLTTGKSNWSTRVRIADDPQEQAAGFQSICSGSYKDTQILFVYDQAFRARFHMRNVRAKLDIGFFDAEGNLFEVQKMHPYPKGSQRGPLTAPSKPFRFALEAQAGYFAENQLQAGKTRLQWHD